MRKQLAISSLVFGLMACGGSPAPKMQSHEQQYYATFSDEDINGIVTEADTSTDTMQPDAADNVVKEALVPWDGPASIDSDLDKEIDSAFTGMALAAGAQKQNCDEAKALVKNLAGAAKLGNKGKAAKIVKAILMKLANKAANKEAADKKANADKAAAKGKVLDLLKKILGAANKNKAANLKDAIKALIDLIKDAIAKAA